MRTNKLLSRLESHCGKQYLHLVGSGTTGLVLAMRVLGMSGKRIVIPNNVCFSVLLAVLAAGNEPIFCDTDEDSQGIAPDALQKVAHLAQGVIAVHNYGLPCDIRRVAAICRRNNVVLIEDVSVALGGFLDGRPLGSFGDISVFSFGGGKLLDIGHGGLICTDDAEISRNLLELICLLPDCSRRHSQSINFLSKLHTLFYNRYFLNGEWDRLAKYSEFVHEALPFSEYAFDERYFEPLERMLERIESLKQCRIDNWSILREKVIALNRKGLHVMACPREAIPWRFNLLLDNGRNDVLNLFLDAQEKVSSWHPPLDVFFQLRSNASVNTPNCDESGNKLLNLWVNDEVDEEYSSRCLLLLEKYLNGES